MVETASQPPAENRTVAPTRLTSGVWSYGKGSFWADCVEKGRLGAEAGGVGGWPNTTYGGSGGYCLDRQRDELGELAEVLGCCGEEELVPGAIRTSQAQPIKFEDAFEVREQHLDLLPLAA